ASLLILDLDAFEEVMGIGPSRQTIMDSVDSPHFFRFQVSLRIRDVQVVQYEQTVWLQSVCHITNDLQVVRRILEIAEAGEEAEHIVDRIRSKRLSHVLPREMEARLFPAFRFFNAAAGEINTRDAESSGSQLP